MTTTISMLFVTSGFVSAIIVFIDEYLAGHPQSMRIMNLVWILTCLWAGVIGLLAYYLFGRQHKEPQHPFKMRVPMDMSANTSMSMSMDATKISSIKSHSMWQKISKSTLHCGAGCTLANILGELSLLFIAMSLVAGWTLDYLLALIIGVLFQYSAIRSMGQLSKRQAYKRAIAVDFWSLTSWQVGMYGFMSIAIFGFGFQLSRLSWEFWFMMQLAMFCGFLTAYPINALLLKLGIKKGM